MSADETTLDAGQLDFAGWLGVLDPTSKASPVLKEIAVSKLAEMYMASQLAEATLAKDLEAACELIATAAAEAARLRAYQRRVINAATPEGYAIIDEALLPGLSKPQTSAEFGMVDRTMARVFATPIPLTPLRLVKTGQCQSCGAGHGGIHSFDCEARMGEHAGGRPEGA